MKKLALTFLFIFCATNAHAFGWKLMTGTYALEGGNSYAPGTAYQGKVTIAPQGENYRVTWKIEPNSEQVGIGVLMDDVLSIAFVDTSNSTFWGVASYKVDFWGNLSGVWTSSEGFTQKADRLTWKHSRID